MWMSVFWVVTPSELVGKCYPWRLRQYISPILWYIHTYVQVQVRLQPKTATSTELFDVSTCEAPFVCMNEICRKIQYKYNWLNLNFQIIFFWTLEVSTLHVKVNISRLQWSTASYPSVLRRWSSMWLLFQKTFQNNPFLPECLWFLVRCCSYCEVLLVPRPISWGTTHRRLLESAYSTYSHMPSISEGLDLGTIRASVRSDPINMIY